MKVKDLKGLLAEIGRLHGFEKLNGGWMLERSRCFIFLDLQKSRFGNCFYLNIKAFHQGLFREYTRLDKSFCNETGDVFIRQPNRYDRLFDLDLPVGDQVRRSMMEELFSEVVLPFAEKACSKSGLMEMEKEGRVYLLPEVKRRLGIE